MDPPREDGRRCLNADELEAAGLRRLTDEEMGARYPNRVGSGVPLYFDRKRPSASVVTAQKRLFPLRLAP